MGNCTNFKELTIEFETTKISFNWFNGSNNFTDIKVNNNNRTFKVVDNILYSIDGKILYLVPNGRTGELVIPNGVETIKEYSGSYCMKIQRVLIPDTVKKIEDFAFLACIEMEELVIGKNVSSLGAGAFNNCNKLKTITIKSEMPELSFGCFNGTNNFTDIKVNNDNKTFKVVDNILYSLDGKTLYLVPTGRIGELVIPDGVEIININAARFCTQIESVVIPDTVKKVSGNAFTTCLNLKTVIINSTEIASKIIKKTSFGDVVTYAETIYIKAGITPGSYITDTTIFKEEASHKDGYVKYVKIS